jgi:predicted phage baseplate assembly protein
VNFSATLKGTYAAATTHINGNGVIASHGESHQQTSLGTGAPNQQLALDFALLTYVASADGAAISSLSVTIAGKVWQVVEDFIDSGPNDFHYTQTQDNEGSVTVNFGNGAQGRMPDVDALIDVRYRTGIGERGMVAANSLTKFQDPDGALVSNPSVPYPVINPEPSFGAKNPTDLMEAKLLAPRTLRKQNRAVTPQDYADALLDGVSLQGVAIKPIHAKAQFVWTGSWTSVIASVDFADRQPLASVPARRRALEDLLAVRKLAGFDVQVEDARYAPLNIELVLHIKPDHFARQVREQVESVIGTRGFFAPAQFDFGQPVRLSDLYSQVLVVEGVQYLTVNRFKRLGDRYPDHAKDGVIDIGPLEIARCDNDPAHPENGVLYLRTCGGKAG